MTNSTCTFYSTVTKIIFSTYCLRCIFETSASYEEAVEAMAAEPRSPTSRPESDKTWGVLNAACQIATRVLLLHRLGGQRGRGNSQHWKWSTNRGRRERPPKEWRRRCEAFAQRRRDQPACHWTCSAPLAAAAPSSLLPASWLKFSEMSWIHVSTIDHCAAMNRRYAISISHTERLTSRLRRYK